MKTANQYFAVLILVCGLGYHLPLDASAPPTAAPQVKLYDANPTHLWNRLHSALFVRTASDGTRFGMDELDPLLWPKSQFLLVGEHHKNVVALLDEFLAKDGHKIIKDPLRRVLFQHDLWSVFDWLANPNALYSFRDDDRTSEARALQIRLAKIIQRLALSAEQIEKLPDNYKAAIDAKAFARTHNPEKPERPFLPPDLLEPEGPWVVLGEHMAPVAPVHVRLLHGRSAVLVLINLPEGRKATQEYLEKLRTFSNPLLPQAAGKVARYNPELPQFPVGTQVALVREMLAIDHKGKLKPTRLIESIQFRVYREIPKGDPADPDTFDRPKGKQDFYELRFTRKNLFTEKNGGLHAVGLKDEEIMLLLPPSGPDDPFEERPPSRLAKPNIMMTCSGCHSSPGIHSVEAYRRSFIQLPKPAPLEVYNRDQQERAALLKKWENYSWGLLQGLMERD